MQEDLFNRSMYINLNLFSDYISVWKLYGNVMESLGVTLIEVNVFTLANLAIIC